MRPIYIPCFPFPPPGDLEDGKEVRRLKVKEGGREGEMAKTLRSKEQGKERERKKIKEL